MPVIAVNLGARTFEDVNSLVEKGVYATVEQFMDVAVLSQLALERGTRPSDLVRGASARRSSSEAGARSVRQAVSALEAPHQQLPIARRTAVSRDAETADAAEVIDRLAVRHVSAPPPMLAESFSRPPSEHIWGQINRLLPLKVAARWLAVQGSATGEWAKLDSIVDKLGDDAAAIGSALDMADTTQGFGRDEALATALPRKGNAASRDRYLSQFVARTTRSGEIYAGAISDYGLAAFQGDRVVLTPIGLDLAKLPNPILDEGQRHLPTLSTQERDLFLRCVLEFVPGEANDIALLLGGIIDGNDSPETLLLNVRPSLPKSWTVVMTRTHLSGVVARAADLDLLRRVWTGRHVTYQATDRGREVTRLVSKGGLDTTQSAAGGETNNA